MIAAQVVSGWWLIFPLLVVAAGAFCYHLGKVVGEDPVQQEHAYNDGYDTGEVVGYMRAVRDLEEAPPMAEGLGKGGTHD